MFRNSFDHLSTDKGLPGTGPASKRMDTIKSNQNKDIEDLHLDQKPKILAKPTPSKKQSVFADIRIPTTDVVTLEKSP